MAQPPSYIRRAVATGNSLVYGVGDDAPDFGWRGALYDLEHAAGRPFFLFGSSDNGNAHVDPYHDGTPGWTLTQIQTIVADRLTRYEPDIWIAEGGTNDIFGGADAATVASRWSSMLDLGWGIMSCSRRSPQIVVLGINRRLDSFDSVVLQANPLIQSTIAGKSYASSVTFIDCYSAVPDALYNVDGVHPTHAGYLAWASFIDANGFASVLAR